MAPLLENIRFEALKKLAAERFGPITPSCSPVGINRRFRD